MSNFSEASTMECSCPNFDHISWNTSQSLTEDDLAYRSFVYVHQIITSFVAIFYLIIISTLMRNSSKLFSSFYTFVFSLAITDLIALTIMASDLVHLKVSRREPLIWYVAFLIQFTWYGSIFNVVGLTISRLVAILSYTEQETHLSKRNKLLSLLIVYVSSLAWSLPIFFPSQRCICVDSTEDVYDWELANSYKNAEIVFSTTAILGCTLLYVSMFIKVKSINRQSNITYREMRSTATNVSSNRRHNSVRNREYKILLQSFIITVSLLGLLIGSYSLRMLSNTLVANVVHACTALINHGINPFLYLAFSSQIRNMVLEVFRVPKTRSATMSNEYCVQYQRTSAIVLSKLSTESDTV